MHDFLEKCKPNDFWQTPEYILERVRAMYPNYFDPCPPKPGKDGLGLFWDWDGVFVNPPFSQLARWVDYGLDQPREQIWLTHHKHDTKWCQKLVKASTAFAMLKKRVKFIDPATGQPRSTQFDQRQTLWYLGNRGDDFKAWFKDLGFVVNIMEESQ